jgi:transposase, IS5 family
MRKRFEPQKTLGLLPIEETQIRFKSRHATNKIAMALLEIYKNEKYRNKILDILDSKLRKNKKYTGRPGMNLWQIFVLGQFRLGLNLSYDELDDYVNSHETIRSLLGIHRVGNFELPRIEISYQNILDNVGLLTDDMVREINEVIVEYSNKEVFKKKEEEACILKTDSYVVKSNVHFPTDYNLLWDCARKSLDMVSKIIKDNPGGQGWRKLKDWRKRIKNGARQVGLISSKGGANKAERLKKTAGCYLEVTKGLVQKIEGFLSTIDLGDDDMKWLYAIRLEEYVRLTKKHIDLLERRIIKGETIDHEEKMFSIFEQYTEWINKGKPFVELGKKLCITTNKEDMIVDYRLMEKEADSEVVIDIAADIL